MSNEPINVDRRRKGEDPVVRADAPERGDSGGGFPSSGGNRPSFGGMPTRGAQLGGCGSLIALLLVLGYYLLTGGQGIGGGAPSDQATTSPDISSFQPTDAALPQSNFTPPVPAASSGQTWTDMLYQDADGNQYPASTNITVH